MSFIIMNESFTQLPADSSGKKLRTLSGSIGGSEVHSEVVVLASPSGSTLDPRTRDFSLMQYDSEVYGYTSGNLTTITYQRSGSQVYRETYYYDGSNVLLSMSGSIS